MKEKSKSPYLLENNLAESYKLLSASAPVSILISTLLAFMVVSVLFSQIAPMSLLFWLVSIIIIHLVRIVLVFKFKPSAKLNQQQIKQYFNYFRIGVLLSALAWGGTGCFFSQQLDLAYQVFIAFTLGGLSAGATSWLASDRVSIIAFIIPIMLPNALFFLSSDNTIGLSMGMMMLLFMAYLIFTAKRQGEHLYENVQLRQQAKRDEVQFREILNFSPIAAAISDNHSHRKLFINQSYLELLEYTTSSSMDDDISRYTIEEEQFKTITAKLDKGHNVTNELIKLISSEGKEPKWGIASFLMINYKNEPAVLSWI